MLLSNTALWFHYIQNSDFWICHLSSIKLARDYEYDRDKMVLAGGDTSPIIHLFYFKEQILINALRNKHIQCCNTSTN